MSTLEQRYRRILGFLPKAYRADRAEEMLTALLDGAKPAQAWPRIGEVLSLGALSVRLRFGAPGASDRGRLTGDVVRRVILVSLMIDTVFQASTVAAFAYQGGFAIGLGEFVYEVLPSALVVAMLFGWWRVGRIIGAAYVLYLGIKLVVIFSSPISAFYKPGVTLFSLVITVVTGLAVFPAFHRETPRLTHRLRWLLMWVAPMVVLGGISAVFSDQVYTPKYMWPTTFAIAGLAAAVFAVKQIKASPVWPIALALGCCPVVLDVVRAAIFPFPATSDLALGLTGGTEVVLIATAIASLAYRRRLVVA